MTKLMLKSFFGRRLPNFDATRVMAEATALHQQGHLAEVPPLCQSVLKSEPDHFDALHLLAVVKLQQGRHEEAEQFFARALECNPDSEMARVNRGSALVALGRPKDALQEFDTALAKNPHSVAALVNRAAVLRGLGRASEALDCYEKVLKVQPQHMLSLWGRANVDEFLGDLDAATAGYRRALTVDPDHFDSLTGLGRTLTALGQTEDALTAIDRAISARPEALGALVDRANTLCTLARHDDALAAWDRVLTIDPESLAARIGRGNVFHALHDCDAALAEIDKAIEIAPDFAGGPYNRATVLRTLRRYDEAIAAYQWAIAINPTFTAAIADCAVLQDMTNRNDDALASFQRLLEIDPAYPYALGNVAAEMGKLCSWGRIGDVIQQVVAGVRQARPVCVPQPFLAMVDDPLLQRACATIVVEREFARSSQYRWSGEAYHHERIRVAYLSPDFHEHPVGFLMAGLLEAHDHERFEIYGVVFGRDHRSAMRERIESTFDHLYDARMKSDADVARMLREREIDIAVDLSGFTDDSRAGIFAFHAAAAQVGFLGFPGTMGSDLMDYIIADRFLIPESQRRHYAESVVCLPDTVLPTDSRRRIADETPTRADAGLPATGFVFCSFNNTYKITPEVFAIWMRLLQRIPGSVLWLVAPHPNVVSNLRAEAQRHGIDPARLVFAKRLPSEKYLAQYRLAELFLDTLPHNAGTTASDALWVGVPIVTCSGTAFAARLAGGLLNAIGLPELITYSPADYEELAFDLATDPLRLASVRQKLARNRDTFPLFDTDRFRRNIEAAYIGIWQRSQRGEPPQSFDVRT
jgi:protein O-GlcNAc transferase